MIKYGLVGVALLLLVGVGYYAVSPIFRTVPVYDESPTPVQVMNIHEEVLKDKDSLTFPVVDTPIHPASGIVRVITEAGKTYIRYENYKTINGPDLFVYLSKDLDAKEFVSLGEIRGTEGNINYEVPEGASLDEYRYVLTWCKQFGVLFNSVDLKGGMETDMNIDTMSASAASEESESPEEKPVESLPIGESRAQTEEVVTQSAGPRIAVMGTGCFWCVEHDLETVVGVLDVVSGYSGGSAENPTYADYSSGGHREVVQVTYDPVVLSYGNLVEHIIKYGDPTDPLGSFGDRGTYYAPVVYYETDAERNVALGVIKRIDDLKVYEKSISIDVLPRSAFWPAETYHQDYAKNNPIRYTLYRTASGRNSFIERHWGEDAGDFIASDKPSVLLNNITAPMVKSWKTFSKPSDEELRSVLTPLQYEVTQKEGTEPSHTSELDKNYEEGIYVDIVSDEPLFSSRDKYNSGTGWPSFVKPIAEDMVTLHEDKKLFSTRTEVRSRYADSHLGHVFTDGPTDRGGMRYCMNGAALRFVPRADMVAEGYEEFLAVL